MAYTFKQTICSLFEPKAIFLGLALFLFIVAIDFESNRMACCWDCGWDSRQALFLIITSLGLLRGRLWSVIISLLLSLKVAYSVGYVVFGNDIGEVSKSQGDWQMVKKSIGWTYSYHPEYLLEFGLAVLIILCSSVFLWRHIAQAKSCLGATASNKSINRTRS